MARYKLILAYEGSAFAGSQRQKGRRTVQGELERALRELGWAERSVTLAGRTDRGVHALGQVAAFNLDWRHSPERLREALNARLPSDMAVRRAEVVEPSFNPRFGATSRLYRYRLFCQEVRDPLRERMAWRVWPPVQPALLQRAGQMVVGRHDFAAFGSPPHQDGDTVRTVVLSTWRNVEDEWYYEVRAEAFLYRMVRRLVFVQVALAQGRGSLEVMRAALERRSGAGELPAGLAPACGLTLVEVRY